MKCLVGNDLIDLLEPEIKKKSKNERFIKRVLTAEEYTLLKAQSDPDIFLWTLWSAKESAYKILKKIIPDLVFAHSLFHVEKHSGSHGIVRYDKYTIDVQWQYSESWIHCIGTFSKEGQSLQVLEWSVVETQEVTTDFVFTAEEESSIYSKESKAVRELAKLTLQGKSLEDIEILRFPLGVRFGPPEIWKDGLQLESWDLSMSHDGRFVSALIAKS
ncbi:hypothetical protein A9Q84_06815 [Halobacteriovorax marinus]|uniref:4'-phosphopantetheinyl transferase domain-containing protein n=1 Tax=Halobacteriovorax marinus TaxID=97084 RepID=A0A1Y5FFB6_9BACT|nr:hypothetical protein A9Q84_06815 [Halobacteriovorax marinus]